MSLARHFKERLTYLYGRIINHTDEDLQAATELEEDFFKMARGMLLYVVIALILLILLIYGVVSGKIYS